MSRRFNNIKGVALLLPRSSQNKKTVRLTCEQETNPVTFVKKSDLKAVSIQPGGNVTHERIHIIESRP